MTTSEATTIGYIPVVEHMESCNPASSKIEILNLNFKNQKLLQKQLHEENLNLRT